jgi:hypothetical protein
LGRKKKRGSEVGNAGFIYDREGSGRGWGVSIHTRQGGVA